MATNHHTKPPRRAGSKGLGIQLLMILCILMPVMVLFLLPAGGILGGGLLFWVGLLVTFWLISMLSGPIAESEPVMTARVLTSDDQPAVVKEVMDVGLAEEVAGVRIFRGRLREPAASVYAKLKHALGEGAAPSVQADEQFCASIVLLPGPVVDAAAEPHGSPWVNWLLFALTVVTTTWAGAAHQGIDLLAEPGRFGAGLPYALGLLSILGVHELGHYFTARHHRIRVTPPYFIPVPFALGTFGAFIQLRSPAEDRRALFDVAVAGPLAGLAVAVPTLLIGLRSSAIVAPPAGAAAGVMHGGADVGSSVMLALLAKLSFGPALLEGHLLQLSPLAFAGWLGLMVTALNLLPIGQLDGGHIARAMFGRRAGETIGSVAMWTLLLLGLFVWPGLLTWAVIIFFIAGRGAPPLDDLTPLTPARRWLGYATFAVLALILAPLPHTLWGAAGIRCPYM
ncbi:site-2 protease family protein [Tautonia sociabilis]|uniref:Site-2 protease family protein n=2 Tax=Tautonia sociabilis TaxID=2080755 RepID=A0A432MIK4_9BACT|nr:site-2 protease family protein [Tautonia sociabilis]